MPAKPMSVAEADSHYRRAQRDLRYLTTAFKTYTDQRSKLRADLERRLDRVGGGPKAFLLEEAVRRMDEEDAEEPDADLLDQYPRSSATARPSYRILSFQRAISKAEERLQWAQGQKEQAMADAEVARNLGSESGGGRVGTPLPPSPTLLGRLCQYLTEQQQRPGISPLGKNLDSRLQSLMRGSTLERKIQPRGEQSSASPGEEGQSWIGRWGLRGVGASKYEYRPHAATA